MENKGFRASSDLISAVGPKALQGPLPCRYCLPFPLDARLFVMFPLAQFRQDACLFASFFETADGAFNRLIVSNSNSGHCFQLLPNGGCGYDLNNTAKSINI